MKCFWYITEYDTGRPYFLVHIFHEYIRWNYEKNEKSPWSCRLSTAVYLWSFLLRSRLCSCVESWEAPEVASIGSCFTSTRLNWLAEDGCPFPEDRTRGEKRQQSYCWSALLSHDEIQSDFCPGLRRILRVIIIVKLCQAVKPFKWWLRGGIYEGKRLLFPQHLSQLICQAAS